MGLFDKADEATKLARATEKDQARQLKQEAKAQQAHTKAMTVRFGDASYLGGLPEQRKQRSGDLVFAETTVTLGKVVIPMGDVASVKVTSQQVAKRRLLGAAFGTDAAVAGKSAADRTDITVYTKAGVEAYFQVAKTSDLAARAALSPLLRELGIPFHDELQAPAASAPVATSSLADELAKLAQLRDQGVLSEEEFAAQKARLLGP